VLNIRGNKKADPREYDQRIKRAKDYSLPGYNKNITALNILTHTAGFDDWMQALPLQTNNIGYYYSGEGFLYLQRWIEERENKALDSIDAFSFTNNANMDFSLPTTESNVVWGYKKNLQLVRPIWYSEYPYVHGTLCCKPRAFAEWWLNYLEDPDSLMFSALVEVGGAHYRTAGMGLLKTKDYELLWQHGNDTWFQNLLIHDKKTNTGFVVFTNAETGFDFINELLGAFFPDQLLAVNKEGLYVIEFQ
jgi:hypothetical protein